MSSRRHFFAASRPPHGAALFASVIIPTFNSGGSIGMLIKTIKAQTLKDVEIIVVDSSSTDGTAEEAREAGARVEVIPREQFDHGGTRTFGGKLAAGKFLIYLTQDAMPADEKALENLLEPLLKDDAVGAVYGRQVPNPDASAYAAHLRLFNYPSSESETKGLDSRARYGIKTAFLSNSFAAYRKSALVAAGWFGHGLIYGEDMHIGAKLLLAGFKLAYAARAAVLHSHNYSATEEARRYFDAGVLHEKEGWMLREFGRPYGEGKKFIKSGIRYMLDNRKPHLVPGFLFRNLLKFAAYKAGLNHKRLPRFLARRFSMNTRWWEKQ